MEKLKTNELSLGLDQTFRNDLVDNFEKIQNGVDGQSDYINKQITDFTNSLNDQLHGLIDGEPIPTNGDTVISNARYLDQDWVKMTSTANTQYRGLAFQIDGPDKMSVITAYPVKLNFNIQSSINQKFLLAIQLYDSNGKNMNNAIFIDVISLKALEINNYQKEFQLEPDQIKGASKVAIWLYTDGTNDLGTVLINDYSAVLEYNQNSQLHGLIDGEPTPTTGDTVISNTEYFGQKWVKMTSTANTQYRGLAFQIDKSGIILAMPAYPVKLNFNIQSSINQDFLLAVHFYDSNDKDMNNAISIDAISLKASEIFNYQKEFWLEPDQIKGASRVAIWLYTDGTNDLGTVLINDYSAVFEYNQNSQLHGLIDGKPTPTNGDTVISIDNYLGQKWVKMTSTGNTQYRGLAFQIDKSGIILAMPTYPVKLNFNIQSSINQDFLLAIHFYDSNGKDMNNAIFIDEISLKALEINNYQKEFWLKPDQIKGATRVAIWLYTDGTNDLGTVLINDYSAVFEYNQNYQLHGLIDDKPTPTTGDTVISIDNYLNQKWVKMTSTGNAQYRGLAFQIDGPDKISVMTTYPVKLNFNIRSSINQKFLLAIHFYDSNGKNMNKVDCKFNPNFWTNLSA